MSLFIYDSLRGKALQHMIVLTAVQGLRIFFWLAWEDHGGWRRTDLYI